MVADDLGDQSKSKATSVLLRGDERIEHLGNELVGNARPVIAHGNLDRQAHPLGGTGRLQTHACPECSGEYDLPFQRVRADRLCRILEQVDEYLDKLIA